MSWATRCRPARMPFHPGRRPSGPNPTVGERRGVHPHRQAGQSRWSGRHGAQRLARKAEHTARHSSGRPPRAGGLSGEVAERQDGVGRHLDHLTLEGEARQHLRDDARDARNRDELDRVAGDCFRSAMSDIVRLS